MTVPPTDAPRLSLRVPAEVQVTEVQRRQAEDLGWWERWRFWLFVASLTLGAFVLGGQVFAMLVLTVAAAEAAVGLAILVTYFRNRGGIAVEDINQMRG